jgi:hypothetical protein
MRLYTSYLSFSFFGIWHLISDIFQQAQATYEAKAKKKKTAKGPLPAPRPPFFF